MQSASLGRHSILKFEYINLSLKTVISTCEGLVAWENAFVKLCCSLRTSF